MAMGPATILVLLVIGVLFVFGALILGSGRSRTQSLQRSYGPLCNRCRRRNVDGARYCAHCGAPLHG